MAKETQQGATPPEEPAAKADGLTEEKVNEIVAEAVTAAEARLNEELLKRLAELEANLDKQFGERLAEAVKMIGSEVQKGLDGIEGAGDGLTAAVNRELHFLSGQIANVATTIERSIGQRVNRNVSVLSLEDAGTVAAPSQVGVDPATPGTGPDTAESLLGG